MIPADLLDQLREKDPGLWERMRRMPIYVHRDSSLTGDLTKSDNTELVAAWLPHCLQEAIRARGWHLYQIRNDDLPGLPCFADIIILGHGKEHDIHNEGEGSTEAEALLRAYIAALSASH